MSNVDDAIAHARALLDPAQVTTVQYATEQADAQEATLASAGQTDVEANRPTHASKITAAVEVLTLAVERLRDEVRQRPGDPRVDQLQRAVGDLRHRHDRLVETVQEHGARLADLEGVPDELQHHRALLRALLVTTGFTVAIATLTFGAVVVLVAR